MTATNFPAVMAEIFKHEGGYSDHPKDPGGATNMGITHITLAEYRGRPVTKSDVKALTKSEAMEIYRKRYWDVIRGDDLPLGIDLVTMDGSVNSGVGRGPKWVQAALRVAQDGKVGPKTITAAWTANAADTINAACDARLGFLKSLETWPTFRRGWERRVAEVRKKALEMAKDSTIRPSAPPDDIDHYAPPDAPMPKPSTPAESNAKVLPKALLIIAAIVIVAVLAIVLGPRFFGG